MEQLKNILIKKGVRKGLNAALIVFLANKELKGRAEALSFKKGTLKVIVEGSSEAVSFKLNQDRIIQEINRRIGRKEVKRIKFQIGK